jgi:hypothetical protein
MVWGGSEGNSRASHFICPQGAAWQNAPKFVIEQAGKPQGGPSQNGWSLICRKNQLNRSNWGSRQ